MLSASSSRKTKKPAGCKLRRSLANCGPACCIEMKLHLPERLAHPTTDALFGASVALPDFGARFTSDKACHQYLAQLWCQSSQCIVDIDCQQSLVPRREHG